MSALHLDPRTKLALILLCVISAMLAPDLTFQFALVALIGLLSVLCGKWRYALRGFELSGQPRGQRGTGMLCTICRCLSSFQIP